MHEPGSMYLKGRKVTRNMSAEILAGGVMGNFSLFLL
jgi:hypothetical protein